MGLFSVFERLLEPTEASPDGTPPPRLGAFYWHYVRQARGLVAALFVAGFMVALLDTTIPLFIGKVVTLISSHTPATLLHEAWPQLVGMLVILLAVRPLVLLAQNLVTNQAIAPGLTNLVRWQSPLARGAAELDLLPERLRRAHRQPRHADRPGAARERRRVHQCRPGTSWSTARTAIVLLARSDWRLALPVVAVVRRLRRLAALLRAAPARSLARYVRRCARR